MYVIVVLSMTTYIYVYIYFEQGKNCLTTLACLFFCVLQIGIECELSAEELVQEIQQTLL